MSKKIIVSALLVSTLSITTAYAADPGLYVTGQLGDVNTHMKAKLKAGDVPADFSLGNNGLAGRLAVGYQFNPNVAVELGYLQLHRGKTYEPGIYPYIAANYFLKQNAIDLAVKTMVPVTDKFNVYGKLGAAYLTTKITTDSNDTHYEGDYNKEFSIAQHKFAPEVAAGISYDITKNVSVDTSWTHIQPVGRNRPGNIDFVAMGISYNFG